MRPGSSVVIKLICRAYVFSPHPPLSLLRLYLVACSVRLRRSSADNSRSDGLVLLREHEQVELKRSRVVVMSNPPSAAAMRGKICRYLYDLLRTASDKNLKGPVSQTSGRKLHQD